MNNSGIKNGLYYGGLVSLLYLILYLVSKKLMFSISFGLLSGIAIPIIFMVLAARATREEQEGFMSFGEGILSTILTYAIGSFIVMTFSYIMSNVIDPSLLEIEREVAMEMIENTFTSLGAPEDQLDLMKDAIEEEGSTSLGMTFIGWGIGLIFPGLIIAAIVSAIMKKNPTA